MRDAQSLNIIGAVFVTLVAGLLIMSHYSKEPERTILLSFDTEPVDEETAGEIAEILDSEGIQATFFVTGEYAEQNPELLRRIAENHEIGCHSQTHKKLTTLDDDAKREEIKRCKETVERVVGKRVLGFRAPWHRIDLTGMMMLEEEGYVYDASVIRGLGIFYPETSGLGEVPVSSVLGIPLEDTVWAYYLKMPSLFFRLMKAKNTGMESYVFHPHQIIKYKNEFQGFITALKGSNAKFKSHSQFIQEHEGG